MKKVNEQNKEEYLEKLKIRWHFSGLIFLIGVSILAFTLGDYIDLRFIIIPFWIIWMAYLIKGYYIRWFSKND